MIKKSQNNINPTGQMLPQADQSVYVIQIQNFINQLPWEYLDKPNPKLNITKTIDGPTTQALNALEKIGSELNSNILLDSIKHIKNGDLKAGADQLFDAKTELNEIFTHKAKFLDEVGDKQWSYQDKLSYIQAHPEYPKYFPHPWQPRNLGSFVTGDDRSGTFKCGPPGYEKSMPSLQKMTPEIFRVCQTPNYNLFLMWGPECWNCGINGPDPRFYAIKAEHPEAFNSANIKKRLQHHDWSPLIPSPGIRPYVVPPPKGSPYYANPNDPQPAEGVRFFNSRDEADYYKYLAAYVEFKKQEGKDAEEYNNLYHQYFADQGRSKKKPSLYAPPNEWSKNIYHGQVHASKLNNLLKLANVLKKKYVKVNGQPIGPQIRALRKCAIEINEDIVLNETEKKIFDLLKQVVADKKTNTVLRVAGGWTRDKLLGKESHDIDISVDNMSGLDFARLVREWMQSKGMPVPKDVAVVEANPDAKKSLETAILKIFSVPIDFVQLRADVYGSETRRPDTVVGVPAEKDAERRDLTINSIFYNINEGKIEDFVGGVEDLKNGIARTPLDPYNTFMEDPLRILRAVRFAAKYNLNIAPEVIEAAKHPDVQDAFKKKISKERIWSELVGQPEGEGWKRGLMVGPNFNRAARLLGEMGLRDILLVPNDEQIQHAETQKRDVGEKPKWEQGFGNWDMDQNNPHHNLNVWDHTLEALNYLHEVQQASVSANTERKIEDQVVRNIAMLMHDMGKCDACSQQTHPEKGHSTYHEHELSSAVMADQILRNLKAPNVIRERVINLIKHHMRFHTLPANARGSALRRIVRDVGKDNWPLLIEMSESDSMGKEKTMGNETKPDPKYKEFSKAITEFLEQTNGESEAPIPLNGDEIMKILGLKRGGPEVGRVLKALKEQMLENPEMTKEEAEAFVRSIM